MENAEKSLLVTTWIALQRAAHDSSSYHELFWSHDRLWALTQDYPEESLEIIIAILQQDPSDEILANLAAGPLEDLIVAHGERVIGAIEGLARRDPKFGKLLGGVWKNAIPDNIWARVQASATGTW